MKKTIMIVLSVYLSLIVFMPKEQILYTLLNSFQKQRVSFKIDEVKDYGLFEDIENTTVIYDKMKIVKIEKIRLLPFIFYNKLTLSTLEPQDSFKSMINIVLVDTSVTYTVFNPKKVHISSNTNIGFIDGEYDLDTSKIKIFLKPNDGFKKFKYKRYFKKTEGGYKYESIIK